MHYTWTSKASDLIQNDIFINRMTQSHSGKVGTNKHKAFQYSQMQGHLYWSKGYRQDLQKSHD